MDLATLKTNLGKEVLFVTGDNVNGYVKRRGSLDNCITNGIFYPNNVSNVFNEGTITTTDELGRVTLQINAKRIYPLTAEAQIDTKLATINAHIAAVESEGI